MTATCSDASRALGEPLAGTAPEAAGWVVLEQPGPWGRKALTDSHLDPLLGEALDVAAGKHSARAALVRRTGRHPDDAPARSRRVWLASTRPANTWLLGGWITEVTDLGGLSWAGLEAGDLHRVHRSMPTLRVETDPLLLVCTNGRRDVCCALKGRSLVGAVRDRLLGRVWETTHLSGHRFAPTAVLLPGGLAYGRLDPEHACEVFERAARGQLVTRGYRGRTSFSRPAQAAEAAVRSATAELGLDALDVTSVGPPDDSGSWTAVVTHRDGRRWQVGVTERRLAPTRPESCGALPVGPVSYETTPPLRLA